MEQIKPETPHPLKIWFCACVFSQKKNSSHFLCSVVQNQQMKQSNMFFTFFHYDYLKSMFHLSFQESISLLHGTCALFSEAHTPSAPHYSLLPPLLPMVSVSPPGRWENCFLVSCHYNSPLLPLTVRQMLVSVSLPFVQWVFHNIESWVFCVPS